jgi:hypothetical protein
MASSQYDWVRYWIERGEYISWADSGFPADPQSHSGAYYASTLAKFDDIAKYPVLILLGEPGIGKTSEVDVAVEASQKRVLEVGATDVVLKYDLRAYGSDIELTDDIFRSDAFRAWATGTHKLHLFLDSLDECQLRVNSVAQILVRKLRECPIDRLYLRISCRTAEWPAFLESELRMLCEHNDTLKQAWGSNENRNGHGSDSAKNVTSRTVSTRPSKTGTIEGDNERRGALRVYELVPLMRRDVISAASVFGIDPASFVAEVRRKDVVPLAIKPLTLKFLLESYSKKGAFASTRADLYAEGCYRLCEEINPSRLASNLTGNVLPEQRLALAARIAAVTIFCNRYAVWTGTSADTNPGENDDVAIRELYNGSETANGQSFAITQSDIKEALNTGLFSSRGPQRISWAHQTYAEYLSAWYLLQHQMNREQIMSLLVQPNDPDGRLVPQLYETAAWLASMDPFIFSAIMRADPVVLMRADVTSLSEENMKQLVASLLAQFEEGTLLDLDGRVRSQYYRLAYPGLSAQLKPYITDNAKSERVRHVAIDIAEACALQDVGPELVDLALNPSAPMQLRINAAATIMRVGNDAAKAGLKSLISADRHKEIDDELKGAALLALWPKHITAQELFSALTPPKSRHLVSLYTRLFYDDEMRHLAPEDMATALAWAEQLPSDVDRDPMYEWVTDSILFKAWQYIEAPGVLEPLARLLLQRSRYADNWYLRSGSNDDSIIQAITEGESTRRILLKHLVRTFALSGERPQRIVRARLVFSTDIPWMIEQIKEKEQEISGRNMQHPSISAGSTDVNNASQKDPANTKKVATGSVDEAHETLKKEQQVLGQLCQSALAEGDRSSLEAIYEARDNKTVSETFGWLLEGVNPRSEQGRQAREFYYQWQQQPQDEPLEEEGLRPEPVSIRIGRLLDKFDGGDTSAWWIMNLALLPKPGSNYFQGRDELESDLTRLPGWQGLDEETKVRIVQCAPTYLLRQAQMPGKWFHRGEIYSWRPAYAAVRALRLLLRQAPMLLDTLSIETWQKWAPLILKYSVFNDGDADAEGLATADQGALIGLAYQHAPQAVLDAVPVLIDRDNKETRTLRVLEHLEPFWDDRIADTLAKKLPDPRLSAYAFGQLLCALLRHNVKEARDFVEDLLAQYPLPTRGKRREAIVVAAVKFATCTEAPQWDVVWALVQRDERFGKAMVERLVYTDHHIVDRPPLLQQLSEAQMVDLYVWLSKHYPHSEDRRFEESGFQMHQITTRDEIQQWRDSIPGKLAERGTVDAVEAIRRMMRELPHISYLDHSLHRAKEVMRRLTWLPKQPSTLLDWVTGSFVSGADTEITDTEIADVIDDWGRPSYQGHYVEVSGVRRWLNQFPDGWPQRLMFKLLQHLQFYNEVKILEKLKVIHSHVTAELGDAKKQSRTNASILVVAAGNVAQSGPTYARRYRTANKLTGHNIVALREVASRLNTPGMKAIVLIDDIIGTGGTYITALETLSRACGQQLQENNIRVFATAIFGLEEGCINLQSAGEALGLPIEVFVPDIIAEDERCFGPKSKVYEAEEDRNEALQIATEYGSRLQSEQPLGFRNGQLLVVFNDNCPNNSLPILWSPGRNGSWYPLFRRLGF